MGVEISRYAFGEEPVMKMTFRKTPRYYWSSDGGVLPKRFIMPAHAE
jgi:hypothetical protein